MVSRDDVARHAGVSSATVSRVINNIGNVSVELKEKVLKSVKELGYKPNIAAKSLRTQKTYNIAYIIPDITNPYYTEIYKGINEYAVSKGFVCHLIEKATIDLNEYITKWNFDGVIYGMGYDENTEILAQKSSLPVVVQCGSSFNKGLRGNWLEVYHDICDVLIEVFDYIFSKGHRNVGLITLDSSQNIILEAYEHNLKKHSIPLNEKFIIKYRDSNYHYHTGFNCMEELIKRETGITAVFAHNDLIAIGAMAAAVRNGLRIPKDISLIGCEDTVAAMFSNPPLTTIKLYKHKQGLKMAEMIINMINGVDTYSYGFKAEFVIRDTICSIT